jgi:hypothetical protein
VRHKKGPGINQGQLFTLVDQSKLKNI